MTTKTKLYVITGYSGKMDGILVVVPAKNLRDAFTKIPSATQKIVELDDLGTFLCRLEDDEQGIRESVENGEIRWFHQLAGQELKYGENLDGAICW